MRIFLTCVFFVLVSHSLSAQFQKGRAVWHFQDSITRHARSTSTELAYVISTGVLHRWDWNTLSWEPYVSTGGGTGTGGGISRSELQDSTAAIRAEAVTMTNWKEEEYAISATTSEITLSYVPDSDFPIIISRNGLAQTYAFSGTQKDVQVTPLTKKLLFNYRPLSPSEIIRIKYIRKL